MLVLRRDIVKEDFAREFVVNSEKMYGSVFLICLETKFGFVGWWEILKSGFMHSIVLAMKIFPGIML